MDMSSSSNVFDGYLTTFKCEKGATKQHTHTRIPDKDLNVYGGSYNIPENNLDEFYTKYIDNVFIKNKQEYLTEKQMQDNGPILVDIDLHYDASIDSRQHTENHIIDLITLYSEEISKLLNVIPNSEYTIFVLEKPNVNMLEDKTKDGIHLIICIKLNKTIQLMLRTMVKNALPSIWDDIPVTNEWDTILDEGVTKGHSNWQLYGSRKPGHRAYALTYIYNIKNNSNNVLSYNKIPLSQFNTNILDNFKLLSAQYENHISFNINENYAEEYEKMMSEKIPKKKTKVVLNIVDPNNLNAITNEQELDNIIENMFAEIRTIDYELKEIHNYVMILPIEFYGPGSFDKWLRVGWALKNTNEKMFLTWVKFSSQSSNFSYNSISDMHARWCGFENKTNNGLTSRSIIYWAKNNASKEMYEAVRSETIDYFINQSVETSTEFDFATVLFNIFKDNFVCASIKSSIWYEYQSHRWEEIDSGSTLRVLISKDMHDIYYQKCQLAITTLQSLDQSDQRYENIRKRSNKLSDICILLKKTSWKNNIMREAQELFYDRYFINKLDQNPYLLCFNNGVIDFKNNVFKRGQPDDYISMTTNIDYISNTTIQNNAKSRESSLEVDEFMTQLFPIEELRTYMWEHLASCLIGTNENQTFNIYTGSGANGKSKLVDLLTKGLGDYKGTVPISLITEKRTSIGSTSSEIIQLKGTRYAVMQEPSKGDKINEGIMKEITGGDPIQGRALFKDMVTFIPQFKLVVTTNTLFDIRSNDDGTWRRIRVCDFKSKFVEEPYENEAKFPVEFYPYQYKIDKKLDSKFNDWAPIFISKLVDIGFRTKGNVNDCDAVLSASDEYRNGQDYLSEFAKDKIVKLQGGKIKKQEVMETFKQWYVANVGRGTIKGKELYDFMDKRYGAYKKGGWNNVAIVYDEADGEPEVE